MGKKGDRHESFPKKRFPRRVYLGKRLELGFGGAPIIKLRVYESLDGAYRDTERYGRVGEYVLVESGDLAADLSITPVEDEK